MTTQHRPSREIDGPKKRSVSALERLYRAVQHGDVAQLQKRLQAFEAAPPEGLWAHRALSLAIEHKDPKKALEMVQVLLASPLAPTPTGRSDFLHIVLKRHRQDLVAPLLDAGFLPLMRGARGLVQELAWSDNRGQGWSPPWKDRIRPEHLRPAPEDDLVQACVSAVCRNAPVKWLRLLAKALPMPLPAERITKGIITHMAYRDKDDRPISRQTIDRAVSLWWIDLNLAQEQARRIFTHPSYGIYPREPEKLQARLDEVMALLAHNEIVEETPAPTLAPSPRRRL